MSTHFKCFRRYENSGVLVSQPNVFVQINPQDDRRQFLQSGGFQAGCQEFICPASRRFLSDAFNKLNSSEGLLLSVFLISGSSSHQSHHLALLLRQISSLLAPHFLLPFHPLLCKSFFKRALVSERHGFWSRPCCSGTCLKWHLSP